MDARAVMPLGIVIEGREPAPALRRWGTGRIWRPVAVLPGAPAVDGWRPLVEGAEVARYHAATLPLRLYPGETDAYRTALSNHPPSVFVVLRREGEREGGRVRPLLVTAAPFEAEQHLDGGDDIVEPVPMPAGLVAWIRDFVDAHPAAAPFVKRHRHDRIQGVE